MVARRGGTEDPMDASVRELRASQQALQNGQIEKAGVLATQAHTYALMAQVTQLEVIARHLDDIKERLPGDG